MTEKELDLLHETTENFWVDFGSLVRAALKNVPKKLHPDLLMRLSEKTSVYGVKR